MPSLNDIIDNVRSGQENEDAFEILSMLAGGLSLAEAMDPTRRIDDKERIREELLDCLSSDKSVAKEYYDRVMIKGYAALKKQFDSFKYEMAGFDEEKRKSPETLTFMKNFEQIFNMLNDEEEVTRLKDVEKQKHYLGNESFNVNPYDVTSGAMYIKGFRESAANADKVSVGLLGINLEESGLNELKNELDESMKHSHSESSEKMQQALNGFIDVVKTATKPYTKEQIFEANKALKELQSATRAYCDTKSKENPTEGTGYERLQIANRLLRATSNISGRVEPIVSKEIAKLSAPKASNSSKGSNGPARYVAVSNEEFEKMTREMNEKDPNYKAFTKLSDEFEALKKSNPKDAALAGLTKQFKDIIEVEKTEAERQTATGQAEIGLLRDGLLPEVDKYISTFQNKTLTEAEKSKLAFAEKVRDTIYTHQANQQMRAEMNKAIIEKRNASNAVVSSESQTLKGVDKEEINKIKKVCDDILDARIKAIEFENKKGQNPKWEQLLAEYRNPENRAKFYEKMKDREDVKKFAKSNEKPSLREFDEFSKKVVGEVVEENKTKTKPVKTSNKILERAKMFEMSSEARQTL